MTDEQERDPQAERAEKKHEAKRRSALVRQSTSLQPYGTPEELAEMVGRMKFMIPGGEKLSDQEIWGLSQAAIIHGLNPLMKEIFWIDGPSPGIRGLRRKGREQLVETFEANGLPAMDFVLLTDDGERAEMFIPDKALAYKCVGMIPAKRTAHADDAKKYADAGAPWDDIKTMIGDAPVTVGYGYITVEEMFDKDNPEWWHVCTNADMNKKRIKNKMQFVLRSRVCPECLKESWKKPSSYSHVQHAQKRAEAHFWKLECDLPFDISPTGEGFADQGAYDENVIDTTAVEIGYDRPVFMGREIPDHVQTSEEFEAWVKLMIEEDERQEDESSKTPEQRKAEAEEASEALYGNGTSTPAQAKAASKASPEGDTSKIKGSDRPLPPERLKVRFDTTVEAHKGTRKTKDLAQKVFLNFKDCTLKSETPDDDRHAVQMYLTGKVSLTDWSGSELMAALKWMEPRKGNNDKWHPNALSTQEFRIIVSHMREVA